MLHERKEEILRYIQNLKFSQDEYSKMWQWISEDENGYRNNGFVEEEKYLSMCISQKYATLQLANSN